MAHHKEQEAASTHVGSGAGKNDEPIGYCFLSLNEMVPAAAHVSHLKFSTGY
jgi:hypothetical protein